MDMQKLTEKSRAALLQAQELALELGNSMDCFQSRCL